jgi:signal transduction histidine kinase
MLVKDQPRVEANRHVIAARWFWLLGLGLIGLLYYGWHRALLEHPLSLIFMAAVVLNLLYFLWTNAIARVDSTTGLALLSKTQVVSDVLLVSLTMYVAGGAVGVVPVLFIIPILESIVLFSASGPFVFSLLSGLLIIGFSFLEDYSFKSYTAAEGLQTALSISLLYLVVGLFASYLASLIHERAELLTREGAVQEQRLTDMQGLNRELEKKTNALMAKEMELSTANERLSALEQAKSLFVAVTTHQLRTPLAAIKWTFNMLLAGTLGPLNEDQLKFTKNGAESTERMIKIVNDLLSIDKIGADRSAYDFSEVEFDELLSSVIFEFTNQAESKHIKIEHHLPEKKLPKLELDQHKIRMALENLIDNAIKYTAPHGAVSIEVSDERLNTTPPSVEIVIGDTGQGIAADDQKKVFGKFFRASSAVKMEPDGSGLGLFITKDIVEKHGGVIWFESEIGKGTKFHFTLPLRQTQV